MRENGIHKIETHVAGLEQKKIPGLDFLCKFLGYVNEDSPKISEEHSEFKWQPLDELDGLEFIPGIKELIKSVK